MSSTAHSEESGVLNARANGQQSADVRAHLQSSPKRERKKIKV